ncbi:hypothetical protein [Thermohalobacter berrensis]|uniref:Uncharacterized protein n=1 Tax=Thermohalobacter berrensis TaxID=99594 RepID=A0A419TA76_9FIRM|nr:hypothetical protein [Thermohalobacter berrensis]RKD34389.1 hypothetical protein BET03_00725 [Thermohalobacter berrensis]
MNYQNAPSLNDSTAVGQGEVQKAQQEMRNMGQTTQGNMTMGGIPSLKNSTSVGQQEIQQVRQEMQKSATQGLTNRGLV